MGNTTTSGKRDRNFPYSIDNLPGKANLNLSPESYGKKKPFSYQQSIDTADDVEEFSQTKVGFFWRI